MAQIYVPDTLEFDFSGIVGSIGAGLVSAGKSVATNLFTQKNISTVVSGIVSRQLQKGSGGIPAAAPTPQIIMAGGVPSTGYQMPGQVATQPIIVSGGGGGMPFSGPLQAPASPGVFGGINPVYLIAGAGVLALVLTRR